MLPFDTTDAVERIANERGWLEFITAEQAYIIDRVIGGIPEWPNGLTTGQLFKLGLAAGVYQAPLFNEDPRLQKACYMPWLLEQHRGLRIDPSRATGLPRHGWRTFPVFDGKLSPLPIVMVDGTCWRREGPLELEFLISDPYDGEEFWISGVEGPREIDALRHKYPFPMFFVQREK